MTLSMASQMERHPIAQATLRNLTGKRAFERGKEYFVRGQVLRFSDHGDGAEALVLGTRAYRVALWRGAERVMSCCNCPAGEAGGFCKHAVALGLRWLGVENGEGSVAACERLIEYAVNSLRQGLLTDWHGLVRPMLDELLGAQPIRESLDLLEGAMSKISEARSPRIEEGGEDGEWERMEEFLCDRHVAAVHCTLRGAKDAARRVLNWQLKQAGAGFDAGSVSKKLYRGHGEAFGEVWRAAYRHLAEEYWRKLSQVDDGRIDLARRRQLAWLAGHVEGGEARVADPMVGRSGESMERLWREFTAAPRLDCFERLKECAWGLGQWAYWRERVFEYLRQRAGESARLQVGKRKSSAGAGKGEDNSERVRIWLEEGEVEEAYGAAKAGGCADDLLLKLAAMRIRTDPAEALVIYQRLIRKSLSRKDHYSADQARKLLRKTHRLMKRLGREEEYEGFVAELSRAFRSQRNFADVIDPVITK